ncbi:MAG: glycosyltransferase family 2 protein [Acidisphaera sp.]|nr:glycosyltransferase family 2 protein [Acidisphaera sp.]
MPTPDISILIATYDRLEPLEQTLRSVLAQRNTLDLGFEIIVVDNHPTVSARDVVRHIAGQAPFPVRYLQDTRRNMSTLRNTGIAAARGTYVAFIDDDEVADPGWTDALVSALRRTRADIAVGPRLAVFADGRAPAYDPQGRFFARDLQLPADAELRLLNDLGKPMMGLGTGNSIFVAATCFAAAEPFSLAFGDAGGEDQELFCRLYREGRRLIWVPDARVTETVLPHRTAIAYRLLRTRREAQHYVTIHLENTERKRLVFAILTAKGLIQTVVGATLAALTFEFASQRRIRFRLILANGLGKLSWRRPVGYIKEQGEGSALDPARAGGSCIP